MFEVKEEAGTVRARAVGKRAVPGDDVCDRQTGHPVVRQSQVTVRTAPVTAGSSSRYSLFITTATHLGKDQS